MTGRRVLVVGARGFVGRHVVAELRARGLHVVEGVHGGRASAGDPSRDGIACDLARDDVVAWRSRLRCVDAVVCAAGALGGDLEGLQARGPAALFEACAAEGVASVTQVSALGAGEHPSSPFLATKARGDEALLALAGDRPGWHVVRPSIVVGRGGATTATFETLAAMPRPVGLGLGTWRLQPIHVEDLAAVVADLVDGAEAPGIVEAAGPEVLTTDALTAVLRQGLGLAPARPIHLPSWLLQTAAAAGGRVRGARLTPETLALLAAGNVATAVPAVASRHARRVADVVATTPDRADRRQAARRRVTDPILLLALAVVWVGSGVASLLALGPRAEALLAGLGLSGPLASAVALAGALLDLALGVAMLVPRLRRHALVAEVATVLTYTALATVALPGLWLDPFAPLVKNVAVIAATLSLLASET